MCFVRPKDLAGSIGSDGLPKLLEADIVLLSALLKSECRLSGYAQ